MTPESGESESGLGVLDGVVGDSGMALADSDTAGVQAAAMLTTELNTLLEAADAPDAESAIVEARGILEDADATRMAEAFAEAEERLAAASDATDSEDVEFSLRQVRQALTGLASGELSGGGA